MLVKYCIVCINVCVKREEELAKALSKLYCRAVSESHLGPISAISSLLNGPRPPIALSVPEEPYVPKISIHTIHTQLQNISEYPGARLHREQSGVVRKCL